MAVTGISRRRFMQAVGTMAAAGALGLRVRPARAAAVPPGKIRFGIQPRPEHTSYADMVAVWREADELGYDSAFTFDHFMPIDGRPGPCFEGWTSLAALAAQTQRIRVGVLVTGNTYRNPALLAKMAATVDHVSKGRLILGMGAGWFEAEHVAYGFEFDTAPGRAKRLVEAGRYYTLDDAPFEPKTVQKPHPPILIGGMGPKVIQPLAARQADIWHFFVRGGDPAQAKTMVESFDALCRKVGRDPSAVEKSISLGVKDIAGKPVAETRDRIRALAEAGVGHFIVGLSAPYDREVVRSFAKDVIPAVKG
jgi:alkanesulfonate monooxygenase SsuD/methylene tetrahydromethanopterin reductase-like flavin-dependent oxidoreductase (luciferase family)